VTEENSSIEGGRNGGFILDAAVGIPDEAKPGSISDRFQSVFKYAP
jgi:hypothetical protein